MKKSTLIISIIITLIIGTGIGYAFGKSTTNNEDMTKKLQDSVVMMKEQSANILNMANLMKSSGIMMQEMGLMYKDDEAVSRGKDLELVGEKNIKDTTATSEGSKTMKQMMN